MPVVEKKVQKPSEPSKTKPKKKKRSGKLSRPKPQPLPGTSTTKQATHLSSNPYRVLKAVVDMMRLRYTSKEYEPLNLEEILEEINLADLKTDTRQWVLQVGRSLAIDTLWSCTARSTLTHVGESLINCTYTTCLTPTEILGVLMG